MASFLRDIVGRVNQRVTSWGATRDAGTRLPRREAPGNSVSWCVNIYNNLQHETLRLLSLSAALTAALLYWLGQVICSLSVRIRGVLWPGSAAPSLWKGPRCKFYISYISTVGVTTREWVTQCLHSSSFNNITVSPSCDESSPLRTAWGQLTSVFSLTWGHSMNHNLNARAKAPPAPHNTQHPSQIAKSWIQR